MRFRTPFALLALCLAAAPLRAQVAYTVTIDDPASPTVHVEADLPATGASTLVSLPAWSPGHYTILNYARYVSGFGATDGAGRALGWEKTDKDTWRVRSTGADRVKVTYDVLADTVNLSGSLLKDDFGFLNGTNLFVHPETGLDYASTVTWKLPAGWAIATGLHRAAPGRYDAPDYDTLVDAPAFVGHFGIDSLMEDGVPIRFAVYPADQIGTDFGKGSLEAIGKIAHYLHGFWGGVPYDSYTVLLYLSDENLRWGGGLEHANSHFDVLNLQNATAQALPFLYSLYSHEYFHAWNVKRIRPVQMWPYDYAAEQYTPLLWLSEGVTDYYADVILERTGLWDADQLWDSFARAAANVDAAPPASVEDASLETWIDPVEIPGNYYYDKGKLLGLLLDGMIRDATDGEHSFDDVMRRLYEERYRAGRGFTTDDVLDFVDDWVDPAEVRAFYDEYVDGRDPLPLAKDLALLGLAYSRTTAELPFLGVSTGPTEAGGVQVTNVFPGTSAEAAGIQVGDVLLKVGEVAVDSVSGDWGARFRERYTNAAGQPLDLVVRRDGAETTLHTTLRTRERTDVEIQPDPAATAKEKRLRDAFLGG